MMAGHGENAVGGPARHIPVLLQPVLEVLQAAPGRTIVDGTFEIVHWLDARKALSAATPIPLRTPIAA